MTIVRSGVLVVILLSSLPALASGKANSSAGKALFVAKCASCHGPEGEGKESISKTMKVTMRHLSGKEVQAKDDATLKQDITKGAGKMKGIKLTDAETANVIAFLRGLKK